MKEGINIEELENFYEQIKDYKRLTLKEANSLFLQGKRDEVINGTLYVIYEYIKNNNFFFLNNPTYDMNDIINSFCEAWINYIDKGKLSKMNNFGNAFKLDFFNSFTSSLIGSNNSVSSLLNISLQDFKNLFYEYLKLKMQNDYLNYNDFISFINEENNEFSIKIFDFFEKIYESLNISEEDIADLGVTKIVNTHSLLIENALRYMTYNVDDVYISDITQKCIEKKYLSKIRDILYNFDDITEREKCIIKKYFGFDGKALSSIEISEELNISASRVIAIKERVLTKIRLSNDFNKYYRKK